MEKACMAGMSNSGKMWNDSLKDEDEGYCSRLHSPVKQETIQRSKRYKQETDVTGDESGQTDNYRHYAFVNAQPHGGTHRIPSLGVELRIPPGALTEAKPLTVSIPVTDNFPWMCKTLSPHVRIEPHLEYKRPIQVLIDHSMIQIPGHKGGSPPPILLYRHHDSVPWQIIRTQEVTDVDQMCNDTGLQICPGAKFGFVHPSYVAITMDSNCQFCLVDLPNEFGVKEKVRRMFLEVYVDVIDANKSLIRIYASHGILSRQTDVKKLEEDHRQGRHVESGVIHVNPNDISDVEIQLKERQPNAQDTLSEKTIPLRYLVNEWTTEPVWPPHVSLDITPSNGKIDITIEASHGPLKALPITFVGELQQTDTPSTEMNLRGSIDDLVRNVPWDFVIERRITTLLDKLSWEQVCHIATHTGYNISNIEDSGAAKIISREVISNLVQAREFEQMLRFLSRLGIDIDEVRDNLG